MFNRASNSRVSRYVFTRNYLQYANKIRTFSIAYVTTVSGKYIRKMFFLPKENIFQSHVNTCIGMTQQIEK